MSYRSELEAIRDELRTALTEAPVAVKAQVAGQLRLVLKDLEALGAEKTGEVSKADELAAKREARGAGSGDPAPSTRRGQSRRGGGRNRTG